MVSPDLVSPDLVMVSPDLVDGFCAWLLRRGFSRQTIRMHLSNVSHFNEHLVRQRTVTGQLLCSTDVAEFFAAYPSWCRCRRSLRAHLLRVRHSVSRFVKYLGEMGLFDPLLEREIHQPLLDAYLAWMARYQHAAAGTLELRAQYLTAFLRWLGTEATPQGLATLTPDAVEAFFLAYAQKVGAAARRSMQSTLRTFFRFCLYQGHIVSGRGAQGVGSNLVRAWGRAWGQIFILDNSG